jgi:cytochrome c biogenesis protein CcdA
MNFAVEVINILTDITIPLVQFTVLRKPQLDSKRRCALSGVFVVAGIAVVASIMRVYTLWLYNVTKEISYELIFVSSSASMLLPGRVLTDIQILVLSQIEVNVAIIYASAPALRPLFTTELDSAVKSRFS